MIKVLYDHEIFSEQTYGGISRYFKFLMDGIKQDPDVNYSLGVLRSNNYYIKDETQLLSSPLFNSLLKTREKLVKRNNSYCKYLVKKGDFSLLHPTYFNPYLLKYLKRPMVLTVHDMTYEALPELFPAADPLPYYKRLMMERADKIIAISHYTKADILRYSNIREEKIEVIHHGIDSAPNQYADVPNLPEDYILFVGARWSYKNFYLLAEAFKKIVAERPNVKLVLAGGGSLAFGEIEYLVRNGLDGKVVQISVTDEQLNTLYKKAICFIYPSVYEGFGLPILEAFKNKCPILLSNSSCFHEIAGNAASYFEPGNVGSLVMELNKIIDSDNTAAALIDAGRDRLSLFNIEKCVAKTINVYREMV